MRSLYKVIIEDGDCFIQGFSVIFSVLNENYLLTRIL